MTTTASQINLSWREATTYSLWPLLLMGGTVGINDRGLLDRLWLS